MKYSQANRRTNAMTLTEMLVVVVVSAFLILILFVALKPGYSPTKKIACEDNLRQIGIAFKIGILPQGDQYATQVSTNEGGAMELAATGNLAAVFRVMSNELSTPKILICPEDSSRQWAANWAADFGNKNTSYCVGLDAAEKYPNSILDGDDNFEISRKQVSSGVLVLQTNTPIVWTGKRHQFKGNIGLADGSVQMTTDSGLTDAIVNQYADPSGFTNRFRIAIP
jgi:prepilin-type processing-associated H-X9-DG protein